jgi:hypothetical protein
MIAIGNSGERGLLGAAEKGTASTSTIVAEAAAWARARLLDPRAASRMGKTDAIG